MNCVSLSALTLLVGPGWLTGRVSGLQAKLCQLSQMVFFQN